MCDVDEFILLSHAPICDGIMVVVGGYTSIAFLAMLGPQRLQDATYRALRLLDVHGRLGIRFLNGVRLPEIERRLIHLLHVLLRVVIVFHIIIYE